MLHNKNETFAIEKSKLSFRLIFFMNCKARFLTWYLEKMQQVITIIAMSCVYVLFTIMWIWKI